VVVETTQPDEKRSWKVVQTILRNSIITVASAKSDRPTPPTTSDFGTTSYISHQIYKKGMPSYLGKFIGCVKVS
jgi:hypothetical protein